jgi:hypothetical protein
MYWVETDMEAEGMEVVGVIELALLMVKKVAGILTGHPRIYVKEFMVQIVSGTVNIP